MDENVLSPIYRPLGREGNHSGYALHSGYQRLPCSLWHSVLWLGECTDWASAARVSNQRQMFQTICKKGSTEHISLSYDWDPTVRSWEQNHCSVVFLVPLFAICHLAGALVLSVWRFQPPQCVIRMPPRDFEHTNSMVLSYLPGVWCMILLPEKQVFWVGDSWLCAVCNLRLSCSFWSWPMPILGNSGSSKTNPSYLYQNWYLVT